MFQAFTFEIYIPLYLELNKQEIVRTNKTNKSFNKISKLNYQQACKESFNIKN